MEKTTALTKKQLIAYALGDLGGCMTFSIMGSFLTRYYINVAMLDTAVLAVMTLVWKSWDAVSNPIMGVLMDKVNISTRRVQGKFRPWMYRSTPLLAISAILVVTAPTLVDGAGKLVVVFVTYLLYETFYTMFNLPYASLLSAMAGTDGERATLSSARGVGAMLGNLIPTALFPVIISEFEKQPELGYAGGVTLCAVLGFLACLMSSLHTGERCGQEEGASGMNLADIGVTFRKNRAFQALCIHGVCQCVMQGVSMTLGTYMFSDVLGNIAMMSIGTMLSMPVNILVMMFAPKLAKKMGLERMIRTGLLLGAGVFVCLFLMHLTWDVNIWIHILINTLATGAIGVGSLMQWGLVGETVNYNTYLTGKRTEGTIYGVFNMLRRVGQAIGISMSVAMLGWVGYDAAAANMGGQQSEGAILGIKVLCLLVPGVFAMGSWGAFRFVWSIAPEAGSSQ